jgi:hypothetical protein
MGGICFKPLKNKIAPDDKKTDPTHFFTGSQMEEGTLFTEPGMSDDKEIVKLKDEAPNESQEDSLQQSSPEIKNSEKKISLKISKSREASSPLRKVRTMQTSSSHEREKMLNAPKRQQLRTFTQVPQNTQLLMIPTSLIAQNTSHFSVSSNNTMGKGRRADFTDSQSNSKKSNQGGSLNFSMNLKVNSTNLFTPAVI